MLTMTTSELRPPAQGVKPRETQAAMARSVETPPKKSFVTRESLMTATKAVVGIAGLFIAWEVIVFITNPPRFLLVGPSAAFTEIFSRPEYYATNAWVTLQEALAGFVLGTALGVLCGGALHYFPAVSTFLFPALVAFDAIPIDALAIVFLVCYGLGQKSSLMIYDCV